MDVIIEEQKVAIEAIATLVNVKSVMAELLLKPAGVPLEIYRPLLYKLDEATGRPLSKRQMAPLILQAVKQQPACSGVPRKIVEIAASWSSYHLAKDELVARGTVQMAQKVLGTIEVMEIKESQRREQERKLVECRWRKKPADTRQLDGLQGQVDRSGKQTMGLFLSVNGWSDHVPATLKQNSKKSIILMDGYDLRCVLSGHADLRDLLLSKVATLNFESEPFLSVIQYLKDQKDD